MNTYLVYLDQAVSVQSLRFGLLNHVSKHKPAQLVLLQSPRREPGQSESQSFEDAKEAVGSASVLLRSHGLPIKDAVVGDPLPRKAIAEEMSSGQQRYDGILLASQSPNLLRFLRFDVASSLERKFHVPVTYVDPDFSFANMLAIALVGSRGRG